MPLSNKKILKIAEQAVKKSGHILLKKYHNFNRAEVELKSHHEILTKADLLSEKIIIREIKNNFPDHRILSEEEGKIGKNSDYLWIIDPIDGTTNFSMHNPLWNISVGVAYKNEIIAGVIYAPVLGELYTALSGNGARMNGKKIKVSSHVKKALHAFCHGRNQSDVKKALAYYRRQKLRELDCRQLGAAAIELAYVAAGRLESIMIPGANSWDVAAGVLLVREAGGKVTDFAGREWNLKSRDILATNGKVHKQVLDAVNVK